MVSAIRVCAWIYFEGGRGAGAGRLIRTTDLKDNLVDLHERDGLAYAHPLPIAESELYVALHLLPAPVIQLHQSLGAVQRRIGPEELRRARDGGEVGADGGTAGDVLTQYGLAALGNYLGDETKKGRPHANCFIDDSL